MANTTFSALKVRVEGLSLNLAVYKDVAPKAASDLLRDQAKPYVTIVEDVGMVPEPIEDHALSTGLELAEVNLWQRWRNPTTDASNESATLPGGLLAGIHGAQISNVSGKRVYTVLVRNMRRRLEEDNNIVRHILDLDLKREL